MANFQYSYMAAICNFDLEPVIAKYFKQNPNGQYESYEVVFKTRDEHVESSYSFIVVFKLNQGKRESNLNLSNFIKAFVDYNSSVENNGYAITMNPMDSVLPQPKASGSHRFGQWKLDK